MKVLQRYFISEILKSVLFTLIVFLVLFSFLDLISNLSPIIHSSCKFQYIFPLILLSVPRHIYELMPLAVLIGTIYVLSKFAAHSEFTIMRISGMSTMMIIGILSNIALFFMLSTALIGEFVIPTSSEYIQKVKLRNDATLISRRSNTGLWIKDVIRVHKKVIGSRFIKIQGIFPNGNLIDIKLYEFDKKRHMVAFIQADQANYQRNHTWLMTNVVETNFSNKTAIRGNKSVTVNKLPSKTLMLNLTPKILFSIRSDSKNMSAYSLLSYSQYLAISNQHTGYHDMVLYKKLVYPFSIFVMMTIALPFSYLHFRGGGISFKVFIGIMLGISFYLTDALFSHLGLLNNWPPSLTAILPSAIFLLASIIATRKIQ